MKTLFVNHEIKDSSALHYEVVEYNGHKFALTVKLRNGDPIGFNYNCCVAIMTDNGDFSLIADNQLLGLPYSNNYYAPRDIKDGIINRCVNGFKDFIKKAY